MCCNFFLNHFRGFFKWTTTKQSSLVYCFLNESQVENAIHNELSEGIKIHSPLYISSIYWIQNSPQCTIQSYFWKQTSPLGLELWITHPTIRQLVHYRKETLIGILFKTKILKYRYMHCKQQQLFLTHCKKFILCSNYNKKCSIHHKLFQVF